MTLRAAHSLLCTDSLRCTWHGNGPFMNVVLVQRPKETAIGILAIVGKLVRIRLAIAIHGRRNLKESDRTPIFASSQHASEKRWNCCFLADSSLFNFPKIWDCCSDPYNGQDFNYCLRDSLQRYGVWFSAILKGMSTETPSERSKQLQFCADIQVRCCPGRP